MKCKNCKWFSCYKETINFPFTGTITVDNYECKYNPKSIGIEKDSFCSKFEKFERKKKGKKKNEK